MNEFLDTNMQTINPDPANSGPELFYDPFAPKGEEWFDPEVAFAEMWARYENKEIEHDYSADIFLRDTQALMMDAHFLGRLDEVAAIAAKLHAACAGNHSLGQSLQGNKELSSFMDMFNPHSETDGHGHDLAKGHHEDDDDEDEDGPAARRRRRSSRLGRTALRPAA